MQNRWKALAALFLGAILQLGCTTTPVTPARPANVPERAMWIGGSDGGVWVELHATAGQASTVDAKVYADVSGEPLFQGKLAAEPPGAVLPPLHDASSFGGWDGTALLLKDGRRLARSE
ncbi:MAG: hypothetical protein ABI972_16770 [Acidobacteriota bacterium]